jgi:hypothetical protein
VNLTGRIEGETLGGQVFISGSTRAAAGPGIVVGERNLLHAKGFAEPIDVFELRALGGAVLETHALELAPHRPPLPVRCAFLHDKAVSGVALPVEMLASSHRGASLKGIPSAERLANVRIRCESVEGDLYGKVVDTQGQGEGVTVRFTAVPPAWRPVLGKREA